MRRASYANAHMDTCVFEGRRGVVVVVGCRETKDTTPEQGIRRWKKKPYTYKRRVKPIKMGRRRRHRRCTTTVNRSHVEERYDDDETMKNIFFFSIDFFFFFLEVVEHTSLRKTGPRRKRHNAMVHIFIRLSVSLKRDENYISTYVYYNFDGNKKTIITKSEWKTTEYTYIMRCIGMPCIRHTMRIRDIMWWRCCCCCCCCIFSRRHGDDKTRSGYNACAVGKRMSIRLGNRSIDFWNLNMGVIMRLSEDFPNSDKN